MAKLTKATVLAAEHMPLSAAVQVFDAALLKRAANVRLLILDVDGVLTDGRLYYSDAGETLKVYNSLDGQGVVSLQAIGVAVAIISGRDSPMVRQRAQQLGIAHVVLGTTDKLPAALALLESLDLAWHQVAVMGDDWPDVPLITRAALGCAPANAHIEVRAVAHWVTPERGGQGAVRALCDVLLAARGFYQQAWQALP
jgi:3-deoxy-D-manno-octulosonate 8-phosphate phosphatase (KDO 8-P phosphatase)